MLVKSERKLTSLHDLNADAHHRSGPEGQAQTRYSLRRCGRPKPSTPLARMTLVFLLKISLSQ